MDNQTDFENNDVPRKSIDDASPDEWDRASRPVRDRNVTEVIKKYKRRADTGLKKYGVTTERTDIDLMGWLTHLQEELMDAVVYIERTKKEVASHGKK